ncbi:hypothetical protein [Baekduia sp. Peel2402]
MLLARKPPDQTSGRACGQPVAGSGGGSRRGFVAMVLGNDTPN